MCAAVLKIDLNNEPQSAQKQAYENCQTQLNEKSRRVLKITLKSLSVIQNTSQFLFSFAMVDQNLECWS